MTSLPGQNDVERARMAKIHDRIEQAGWKSGNDDLDSDLWGIAVLMAQELEQLIGRLDQLAARVEAER